MRMKEHFWPAEEWRRPRPIIQAIKVGLREAKSEFKREVNKQKLVRKLRENPDVF